MQLDQPQLIYKWCSEALKCLKPHLTEESHLAFSDLVERERKSKAIYDTAADIAVMISSLSPQERATADTHLVSSSGISSAFFLNNQLKKARAILKRGAVQSEQEYELLRNVILDQDVPPQMVDLAERLLVGFKSPNR